MDELIPFYDETGEERRCGSLTIPPGMVSAFADYSSVVTPYDDSDIRKLITDRNRVPSRVTFDAKWTQNQRSHGSCNGYLVAQLVAKMRWLTGTRTQDAVLFSGAYAYSKMNGHQDRGSILEDGVKVACEKGLPPESLVPWDQIYPELQPRNADEEAKKNLGFNPLRTTDFQQVRTALAQQIPVGVAVQAGRNFQTANSKGIAGSDRGMGNHAVVADDLVIIDGHEYADVHNQWGNAFGSTGNGRVYLPFDSFVETIRHHYFYILMSVVTA